METPFITKEQMIEVDRIMMDKYNIELLQMMEHAGYQLANFIRKNFELQSHVVIMAGSGGNGGGGLIAARRLFSWGYNVSVILSSTKETMRVVIKNQVEILEKAGVNFIEKIPDETDIILDCLVGYSIKGKLGGRVNDLVSQANEMTGCKKISLDVPSGLDSNMGIIGNCFRADYTLTIALPKLGLKSEMARKNVGQLYLIDIGVPYSVYNEIDVIAPPDLFSQNSLIKVN